MSRPQKNKKHYENKTLKLQHRLTGVILGVLTLSPEIDPVDVEKSILSGSCIVIDNIADIPSIPAIAVANNKITKNK